MYKNIGLNNVSVDKKIAVKFSVLILILMFITIGVSSYIYVRLQKSQEDHLSGALALILSESIKQISISGIDQIRLFVKDVQSKSPDVDSISVETFDGIIIAHSNPEMNNKTVDEPSIAEVRDSIKNNSMTVLEKSLNGKIVKEIIIPITNSNSSKIIRLQIVSENLMETQMINLIKIIAAIILLSLSAMWVVLIFSKQFGGSFRKLAIQLQGILDNSHAFIYMKDLNGRYLFVNRHWSNIFKTTNDDVRGKTDLDIFPENTAKGFMVNDQTVFKNCQVLEIEETALFNDGYHIFHSIKAPLMDNKNNIYAICGISTDITDSLKITAALKDSEEIFSHFMENSPIYVFFKDENIRPIRLSRNFEKMLGMPIENILGKSMDELFPSDLARSMVEDDKRVLMDGKVITVNEVLNGKYYTTIKFPIVINGSPRFLAGYTIDITEKKLAEDNIISERERLLVTLRSIGDAVITTDIFGNITLMNRVAESLTGYSSNDAFGKPIMEILNIVDENSREKNNNPIEMVIEKGSVVELPRHTILINRDGSERLIEDSAAPIRDQNSNVIGVVLVFRDITEKKKTEILLQNSQKLESLGILAGGIAHDFNNLLGGLFGYLDLLQLHLAGHDSREIQDIISKIMQVFDRTKSLTQQLLTFAKGGEPIKKSIPLNNLLISTVQFVLSGKNVRCNFAINKDLWHCIADENQISQVIDNIIINAVQSMPLGGIITVSADNLIIENNNSTPLLPNGHYVQIKIADQGHGMSKAVCSRIFDPFYTTKISGTGLGLTTSFSIIKKHGGVIDVESKEGHGSTFIIYLPADSSKASNITSTLKKERTKFSGRILIMDDEVYVRNTTRDLLTTMGFHADTAINSDEAVERFRSAYIAGNPYKFIILDLTIKGGRGGKDTLDIIKLIDSKVISIATSGYSDDPIMADPVKYGFSKRLIKPYRLEDLREIVSTE